MSGSDTVKPPSMEDKAKAALSSMKLASETVRSAIASAIPVASNQILTVSVPGTIIDYSEFVWKSEETIRPPLAVRVAEARLVDGMIPLHKFTSGKTGKSVARSYLSTLDLMVPLEASVSGVIGGDPTAVVEERLRVVRNRYDKAMDYLKSADDAPGSEGRSKLGTYVLKQSVWAQAVADYNKAQNDALAANKPPAHATKEQVKESREMFMRWIQEQGRDYKNTIQAKYMDWVVHGYKFMIDFNFGIVDISSGMKRIENSKEAFRNLTLIAEDGVSEYSSVNLTPRNWASIVQDKVVNWGINNATPSPTEIRAEIRRMKNLLASHETLLLGLEEQALFPVISQEEVGEEEKALRTAYADVYANVEAENAKQVPRTTGRAQPANALTSFRSKAARGGKAAPAGAASAAEPPALKAGENPFKKLVEAQQQWNDASLSRNKNTVRSNVETESKTAQNWLKKKIGQLTAEIEDLEKQLGGGGEAQLMPPTVYNQEGIAISEDDMKVNPDAELVGKKAPEVPSFWTRVSCKASASSNEKFTSTTESASAVAAKVGFGLFSASGGASHSSSAANAMSSMANLDVEVSMDCMVVEIDRPWLHGELFIDAELDSGMFDISPGEASLKAMYDKGETPKGEYQQFSSYPTAFVVASDVELSFSGDTTQLESAVSASSTAANLSVGYGPFSISGSHKQSKSKSKTKMESTATGCRIKIQAPQIIGWVQTLMPQLPKPKSGHSTMVGLW
ncbi:hypothetical protein M011DRAFT_504598 [Sporormia fimetaria CBS 119925]|uniref:Uncharacterized protein n=1 Tax=Sporormia fimetaria CBS 119925 TaxID=1340428 RepID=A0A6A6V771_9PLEO|nr:hypothetical protein M011DRAFT_504598 [Sporormia fimetaria CBS 119925]